MGACGSPVEDADSGHLRSSRRGLGNRRLEFRADNVRGSALANQYRGSANRG